MELPGEDLHGFRALAERSVLADEVKDAGNGSTSAGPSRRAGCEKWKRNVGGAVFNVQTFCD